MRALEYVQMLKEIPNRTRGSIEKPAVLGAVIDLNYCLNLFDSASLLLVKQSYELLRIKAKILPENKKSRDNSDLLLRKLDCAVIETLHAFNRANNYRPYDSVRGGFSEGQELYPNAGFKDKNHIQICVRNPNCIKGYFIPLEPIEDYVMP